MGMFTALVMRFSIWRATGSGEKVVVVVVVVTVQTLASVAERWCRDQSKWQDGAESEPVGWNDDVRVTGQAYGRQGV